MNVASTFVVISFALPTHVQFITENKEEGSSSISFYNKIFRISTYNKNY